MNTKHTSFERPQLSWSTPFAWAALFIAASVAPAPAQQCFQSLQWSNYVLCQQTSGAQDSRYPRINNQGEFVFQRQVGGQWQVFSSRRGQLTRATDTPWTDATSPAIADDGSFVCFRHQGALGSVLKYPGPQEIEFSIPPDPMFGSTRTAGPHPSMASDGDVIWYYTFYDGHNDETRRNLFTSSRGRVIGPFFQGDYPDVNAAGDYVFMDGGQIYHSSRGGIASGSFPHLGDAPKDNPDIVYVSGTELRSTVTGVIGPGSWVDVNRSGVIVFEYFTNGHYQIFKGYPLPRIVSNGATNAIVGLPYQYDDDNTAEAYGYSPGDDPSGGGPIQWSILAGPDTPPDFTIDPTSGEVRWTPMQEGTNRVTIAAENINGSSTQLVRIVVIKPTIELVDARTFRPQGSPELYADPNAYFSGGDPCIGVTADGASRLVVRARLEGIDTSNPNLNLHFAIENATGNDGSLKAISSMNWAPDVPAEFATDGTTHKPVCIYESPRNYQSATKPVVIQLHDGARVLARKEIQVKRPPVVLVHGTWSSPQTWTALPPVLQAQGYTVYFANYEFSNGAHFSENVRNIFERTTRATVEARLSGYAASQVDIIAHSMGGVLARLHIQSSSIQLYNYGKGDVHKLITIGSTHWGSFLAGVRTAVKTCNPPAYDRIREAVLTGSAVLGAWPPIDLDGGAAEDQTPGSPALGTLRTTLTPSHAVVTTAVDDPGDNPIRMILFLFSLGIFGDGVVTLDSARGGIADNAYTLLPGVFHWKQTGNSTVAGLVSGLLSSPVETSGSGEFGYFPPSSVSPADLGIIATACIVAGAPVGPALAASPPPFGDWLEITGVSNGVSVMPGQQIMASARATDARSLRSVMFVVPAGVLVLTNAPFTTTFQIPSNIVGSSGILAIGKDASGQTATASVSLNAAVTAEIQSLEVRLPPMPLATPYPQGLRVQAHYSDGVTRDVTLASAGTKYGSSDRPHVRVDTNGVLRAGILNTITPVTIWITNGTVWTNIQVTVDLLNLPPTAVITASKTNGPAPLDIQFDGTQSRDAELLPITYHWGFDDGTTSDLASPMKQFLVPGNHTAVLTVTDPQGLISIDRFTVTVESRLIVNALSLNLTQRLAFDEVTVTNGGMLSAPAGLDCGNLLLMSSILNVGTNSTVGDAVMRNSQLFGTNAFTMNGDLRLNGSNYIHGTGVLRATTVIVSGSNLMEGSFGFGALSVNDGALLVFGGTNTMASLLVAANGVVTTVPEMPLTLTVNDQARVLAGGMIDVQGKGYQWQPGNDGRGPGGGRFVFGAGSYGGLGGISERGFPRSQTYGSAFEANDLGSSGAGNGGAGPEGQGGGLIRLKATQLLLDGILRADAADVAGRSVGAGSGGGVRLEVGTLTGRGLISADGGDNRYTQFDYGGAGGGGDRIAIYYTDRSGFTGQISAKGGNGTGAGRASAVEVSGGAGTIYLKKADEPFGELIVDNGGKETVGWSTSLTNDSPIRLAKLTLGGCARVDVLAPLVTGSLGNTGSNYLRLLDGAALGDATLSGTNQLTLLGATMWSALRLTNGATLTTEPEMALDLAVSNLVVGLNSAIDVQGKGYQWQPGNDGRGPGGGRFVFGAGSYGGLGGISERGFPRSQTYGSAFEANDLGSSGAGNGGAGPEGQGGGLIRLKATQLLLDGILRADAADVAGRSAGAGSGGGVRLEVGTLTGRGLISADGGDNRYTQFDYGGAGGGGGRIAIYYTDRSGFTGQISAKGGNGTGAGRASAVEVNGGAGTIYLKNADEPFGELIVDNGGKETVGWSTPLVIANGIRFLSWKIAGKARVSTTGGVRVLNGIPTEFQDLIRSNYLQVGGLLVSNTWVYGDVMDLAISQNNGLPRVTLYCQPGIPHLIQAATDFTDWFPLYTNTPSGSSFDFIDSMAPSLGRRFYRAVRLEQVVTNLSLSLNPTNRHARIAITAKPNKAIVTQASTDLLHWINISTDTPATNYFQVLDTNALSFDRRFYRAVGQGK